MSDKAVKVGKNMIVKTGNLKNRLMIGIPMTGLVRAEWMMSRYGQVIPCNWSLIEVAQWIDQYSPINFLVADARNLVVQKFLEAGCEWLLFIDSDVCLPGYFFVSINEYMINKKYPVVSGIYFTKSVPSEPLIYREAGDGYFSKWKFGDKVWAGGIGMGSTLIHNSLLRVMWEESEEYKVANVVTRKVFDTPSRVFYDPQTASFSTSCGTEDLYWCDRCIKENVFEKAGWKRYQKMKYPFLVDTHLFSYHIDMNGKKYPSTGEDSKFVRVK